MRYAVSLSPDDNGTLLVTVPDVPEAITFGDSRAEALERAVDAIESAFMAAMAARADIPEPKARGRHYAVLPALTAAKIALYRDLRIEGMSKTALARRMGVHLPQIDRLLDLRHQSRMDMIEKAFAALGKVVSITIRAA